MRRTTILATLTLAAALVLPLTGAAPAVAADTCDGKVPTIVLPPPADDPVTDLTETPPVTGTPGDDVILGTAARDTIDGAGGDDTICGLGGDDTLRGGTGDDRLFGGLDGVYVADEGYWGDLVVPGPGDDHVDLGHDPQAEDLWWGDRGSWDQVSFRDATGPVTVDLAAGTATGEGTDTIAPIVFAAGIEGSAHADRLSGTDLDDWITAGGGDDVVDARGGDDRVDADRLTSPTYDDLPAQPGDDVVHGGSGRDDISGGWGTDRLHGDGGADEVEVERGTRSRALGGRGDDLLGSLGVTGTGTARLVGGGGDDLFMPRAARAADRVEVQGGGGRDRLLAGLSLRVAPHRSAVVAKVPAGTLRTRAGVVVRFGGVEVYDFSAQSSSARITWHGSARAERLDASGQEAPVRAFGAGGADVLEGGLAADLLDGGAGRDRIDGGQGRDRCLRGERLAACEVRR